MHQILIIGSLNADLTTLTPRLPAAGETLTAHSFTISSGGKGANQAVACARLSHHKPTIQSSTLHPNPSASPVPYPPGTNGPIKVAISGAIGRDPFGTSLLRTLQSSFIDTSAVHVVPDTPTGTANIIVEAGTGENRILLAPGANGTLTPADFPCIPGTENDPTLAGQTGSSIPDLVILQLEIPLATVTHVLQLASTHSPPLPTLLNPAPALHLPSSLYPLISHLVLNETEASILSDRLENASAAPTSISYPGSSPNSSPGSSKVKKGSDGSGDASPTLSKASLDLSTTLQLVHSFLDAGVRQTVVITLGARGAVWAARTSVGVKCGHVPAPTLTMADGNEGKVNVVDTTGAGDTFLGGYAVGMVRAIGSTKVNADGKLDEKVDVEGVVRWACKAAGVAVGRVGAMDSVPWGDEV